MFEKKKFTSKIFKGVYACNQIPHKKIKESTLYVVNLQTSDNVGDHWVSIFLTPNQFELFDSGGRLLVDHVYLNHLKMFHSDKKFKYNPKQIQGYRSDLCGEFVCLFAIAKATSISTKKFVDVFNAKNLDDNDYLVLRYFKKYFNCTKIKCSNRFKKIGGQIIQLCVNLRDSYKKNYNKEF